MHTDGFSVEFRPRTCQWIDSKGKCGTATQVRKSYCEEHYNKAYQTATDSDIDTVVEKQLKRLDKRDSDWQVEDSD
jgi:hypothetical protein